MSAIATPGNLNGKTLRIVTNKYDDGIILVDDELSLTSTNPVLNKVITTALYNIADDFADFAISTELSVSGLNNKIDSITTKQVYLTDDLVFRGNYTLGLKKLTTSDIWTAPKGMSLHDMLVELFTGEYEAPKTYYYVGTDRDTPVDKAFLTSTATGHSSDDGEVLTKTFDVPYKTLRIVYAIPGNHTFQKLEIPGMGEVTDNDETFEQPYGNEIMNIDGTSYRVVQYKAPIGKKMPDLTLKFTFN